MSLAGKHIPFRNQMSQLTNQRVSRKHQMQDLCVDKDSKDKGKGGQVLARTFGKHQKAAEQPLSLILHLLRPTSTSGALYRPLSQLLCGLLRWQLECCFFYSSSSSLRCSWIARLPIAIDSCISM